MSRGLCMLLLIGCAACGASRPAPRTGPEDPKTKQIKNYDFQGDTVDGDLAKPDGNVNEPGGDQPDPATVRWSPTTSCDETCRRLAECKLAPGTRDDCAATCSSADEDEVLLSAFTCYGAARDCNDLLECSRNAP